MSCYVKSGGLVLRFCSSISETWRECGYDPSLHTSNFWQARFHKYTCIIFMHRTFLLNNPIKFSIFSTIFNHKRDESTSSQFTNKVKLESLKVFGKVKGLNVTSSKKQHTTTIHPCHHHCQRDVLFISPLAL